MKSYNTLYFGNWGYGMAGLKALKRMVQIKILNVFTKYDANDEDIYLNQVKNYCSEFNLRFTNTEKKILRKDNFESEVLNFNDVDLIISCCYDRIFNNRILKFPNIAAVNVHPSLLPKYRGVKPLENAIVNGDNFTGVTIHLLSDEIDSGAILLQKGGLELKDEKTFREVYDEQCNLISEVLADFLADPEYYIQNKYEQDPNNISYAPRININFSDNFKLREIRENFLQMKDDE